MIKNFLSIGMMSCTAEEKYRSQQRGCCETWISHCNKVYSFCGNHHDFDFEGEMINITDSKIEFVHFNDAGEDYNSASYKFWYGLAWLLENDPAEWYGIVGTDNYVRYFELIHLLKKFNSLEPLTLGGTTQYRTIKVDGVNMQIPFNIGGGGNFITHQALEMIFDCFPGTDRISQAKSLISDWNKISVESNRIDFIPACDVALGYYSWELDIPMIANRGLCPIDWTGYQFWAQNQCYFSFNVNSIIICHYMDRALMHEYHHYLGFDKEISANQFVLSKYNAASNVKSDINEHISTLNKYAAECNVIAECGVRSVVSTWAFMEALRHRGGNLHCVDIVDVPMMKRVIDIGATLNIKVSFHQEDSAKFSLPEPVDLLFIDTWHVYGHLKRELEQHHSMVNKYIIMHDTTVDEFLGESIRLKSNLEKQSQDSGYPIYEIARGLWPAIEEFLQKYPRWVLHKKYTNCNGLTILKRT